MEWRTIYVIFCTTELLVTNIFLDSSMVERTAVNRDVVGSSPTRGVFLSTLINNIWLRGQAVKTSPFHGGNTGSIPVGVIYILTNYFRYDIIQQLMAT